MPPVASEIIAVLFFGLFVAATLFLFVGSLVIHRLPRVVRLREAQNLLSDTRIDNVIPSGDTLRAICARALGDLVARRRHTGELHRFTARQFGDVADIVHYRQRNLRSIVSELRTYSFLVWVLGILGISILLNRAGFPSSVRALWDAAVEAPVELLAVYESIMWAIFIIRFYLEYRTIGELLGE